MNKARYTYKSTDSEVPQVLPTKNGYEYFTFKETKLDTSWVAVNNKAVEVKE
jgi:hypothetical protein